MWLTCPVNLGDVKSNQEDTHLLENRFKKTLGLKHGIGGVNLFDPEWQGFRYRLSPGRKLFVL